MGLRLSPPVRALLFAGWTGVYFLAAPAPTGAGAPASRPRVYLGEMRADTIVATPQEIRPAAEHALEKDHWAISASSTGSRVVTEWKDFRHPLARLLMGKLRARCVVDIQPLDDTKTIVRFQGGLASDGDVADNPAFAVAQSTYRGAVEDFYHDLAAGIAEQRNSASSEALGSMRSP